MRSIVFVVLASATVLAAVACSDQDEGGKASGVAGKGGSAGKTGGTGGSGATTGGSSGAFGGSATGGSAGSGGDGLDARPSNMTCFAPTRPPVATGGEIAVSAAFPNMDFDGLAIGLHRSRHGAGGPLRWFVVERDGDIWTFVDANASKDGLAADGTTKVEAAELFFDLPADVGVGGEGGLLGVTLDPEFGLRDDANYLYTHYTTYPQNEVWRFRVARQGSAFVTVESTRIFTTGSGGGNHWGGDLRFGPDGYLYISLGDGGGGYPAAEAQTLSWLRGKILRIDPRAASAGYAIPPSNPYRLTDPDDPQSAPNTLCDDLDRPTLEARSASCPEIYARGFRNPWRISFDRETGRLWVGDVGTGKEEVDLVLSGHNYGWTLCDGVNPTSSCPPSVSSSMIAPVAQFRQGSQVSVTGGYVYRGTALGSSLQGAYVFSEVYSGELYVIDSPYANVVDSPFAITNTFEHPDEQSAGSLPKFRKIANVSLPFLVSFAEDESAELYAITFGDGKGQSVWKLVPPGAPSVDTIPTLLSETGCVDPQDPSKPAPGVIPYELNAPFWSDGAVKERFLAIPDGTTIEIGPDSDWDFPDRSVLVKHFRLGGKLIETRLFVRHLDSGWAGYSWVWRDDQTDAVKANPAGESRNVSGQIWRYPSRAQCMGCHTAEAGHSLGLETRQLNRDFTYVATGRVANQIDTLSQIGMFSTAPAAAATLPAFVDPFGSAPLATRARVYLHANCSNCHRPGRRPDLLFDTPLSNTNLCDAPALLVPGSASSRLATILRDPDVTMRMPKNAGSVIDDAGASLIESWIGSITSCP